MDFVKLIDGKKTAIGAAILLVVNTAKMLGINIPIEANDVQGILSYLIQIGGSIFAIIGIIHKVYKSILTKKEINYVAK